MQLGLSGRVALVTGGSSGIGAATAEAFGVEEARVAITYREHERAAGEVARRVEEAGGEALTVPLDLSEPATIDAAVAAVVERWGGIDVLVANAVQWPTARAEGGRFESIALAEWQRGLRTNLEGTVATVHAALPSMRDREWGRIVLVSSSVGEEGMPGPNPYGVAKSALNGLARTLAWDVGRDGILVNELLTGFTMTERNLESFPDSVREQVAERIPSGRLSSPHEVATLIVFLASAANSNITGESVREGSSTGRSSHVIKLAA